jgi:hypothetical protein
MEMYSAIGGQQSPAYYKAYDEAKPKGNEIPSVVWSPQVIQLHPLVVYKHDGLICIVISRNDKEERGYCAFSPEMTPDWPDSIKEEGWVLKPLGAGLLEYRKDLRHRAFLNR